MVRAKLVTTPVQCMICDSIFSKTNDTDHSNQNLIRKEVEFSCPQCGHEIGSADAEKMLVAAVLGRAIRDLNLKEAHTRDAIKSEAMFWLKNEETFVPFSFLWICEQLDLEPEVTRASILEGVFNENSL